MVCGFVFYFVEFRLFLFFFLIFCFVNIVFFSSWKILWDDFGGLLFVFFLLVWCVNRCRCWWFVFGYCFIVILIVLFFLVMMWLCSCFSLCSNVVVCECLLCSLFSVVCSGFGLIWCISLLMYCSWWWWVLFLKCCVFLMVLVRFFGSGNLVNVEGFSFISFLLSFCRVSMLFFNLVLLI